MHLYAGEFSKQPARRCHESLSNLQKPRVSAIKVGLLMFSPTWLHILGEKALFFNPIAHGIPKGKWKYNVLCQVTWQVSNERISWQNLGLNSNCTSAFTFPWSCFIAIQTEILNSRGKKNNNITQLRDGASSDTFGKKESMLARCLGALKTTLAMFTLWELSLPSCWMCVKCYSCDVLDRY